MGNNNNSGDSGFKNFLILVLLIVVGYMAWKSGLLSTLLPDDPQVVQPTAVVVPQQVPQQVPQTIVTATPLVTQPEYIPTATPIAVQANSVDPEQLSKSITAMSDALRDCVNQQIDDPFTNYHCERYRDALDDLAELARQYNQ